MHGGDDGDGLFGDIYVGEDFGGFRDAGQSLVQDGWVEMVEVEVDVVFLGTHSSAFHDLHSFGPADHVS